MSETNLRNNDFKQYLSYLSRYASPTHSTKTRSSLNTTNASFLGASNSNDDKYNSKNNLETKCQNCGRLEPNQIYVNEFTTTQFIYSQNATNLNTNTKNGISCGSCSRLIMQLKEEALKQREANTRTPPSALSFRSSDDDAYDDDKSQRRSAFRPYNSKLLQIKSTKIVDYEEDERVNKNSFSSFISTSSMTNSSTLPQPSVATFVLPKDESVKKIKVYFF
jgi:hypothetical protein